jgi:hypothetical protein
MFPDTLGKEEAFRDHAFSQFLIPPVEMAAPSSLSAHENRG